MMTGLNNQRLCLVGLLSIAQQRSTSIVLPLSAIDYAPRVVSRHKEIPLEKLFDLPTLRASVPPELLSDDPPDELISFRECFYASDGPSKSDSRESIAARILMGTVATPRISERAAALGEWIADRGAIPIQLRIERDWQEYVRRKWGSDSEQVKNADPVTLPPIIPRS